MRLAFSCGRASTGVAATCLLAVLACAGTALAPARGQAQSTHSSEQHAFRVVTVASGLVHPWSIAFLPDGDILITERPGRLRLVHRGVLQREPIAGLPEVHVRREGGLLDVAVHPDFASNRLLYLSFSRAGADGQATTAVMRGTLQNNRLSNVEVIFVARAWSGEDSQFGSRLAFDFRGYLFVTVGDRAVPTTLPTAASHPAQDISNHSGTVVRLHDDGRVPSDNPFVGRADARPEIWSYGHRNPQGLLFDPETGNLWGTEHGPQGGDELNRIQPGRNYGWPVIGFGIDYDGSIIHRDTIQPGMEQPVHYWVPSIAPSGLLLYTGDQFPEWRGSLFVGGMSRRQVARLTLDGQRIAGEETLLKGVGRVRDIRQGPDGFIYLALDDQQGSPTSVVRLEPIRNGSGEW